MCDRAFSVWLRMHCGAMPTLSALKYRCLERYLYDRWMAGQEVDEGVRPVLADGVRATYGFDNGVIGSFESHRGQEHADTVFGVDVVGEEGQLAFRGRFTKCLFFYPHP